MDFQDTVQLVLDTKKLCAPGIASQVLSKAKEKLRRDHDVFLRSQTTIRVPMASPPLKKHILSVFENAVRREPNVPSAMKQYLCCQSTTPQERNKREGEKVNLDLCRLCL